MAFDLKKKINEQGNKNISINRFFFKFKILPLTSGNEWKKKAGSSFGEFDNNDPNFDYGPDFDRDKEQPIDEDSENIKELDFLKEKSEDDVKCKGMFLCIFVARNARNASYASLFF